MQARTGRLYCDERDIVHLKVIYHPLYSMNNFVTNKSKLPQEVFSYMG